MKKFIGNIRCQLLKLMSISDFWVFYKYCNSCISYYYYLIKKMNITELREKKQPKMLDYLEERYFTTHDTWHEGKYFSINLIVKFSSIK